ncbi:MAG TPA: hypothetical protein VGK08_00755 [Thermoanaerobaculia bacterium]
MSGAQTGRFYTVTPCRIVDTRGPVAPNGGPALNANTERRFTIAGYCGIPSGAGSVAVNVTVTGSTAGGNLRVYAAGGALPGASAINYAAGQTRANNGTYGLSGSGELSVFCTQSSGSAHVVLDVSGWFEGTPPTPPPGGTGTQIWARRMSGNNSFDNALANSIAVDGQGNVVVAGSFERSVDFGGGNLTSAGGDDVFVAKFSSSGAYLWARRFGGSSDDFCESVTVDGAGDIVLAGYFNGSADFGSGLLTSAGGTDIFLAKYSSAGSPLWSRRFGSTSTDRALSVDADNSNNYVVAGYMVGTVDFGGGPLTSAGLADVFVAKYSSAGVHVWSRRFGGASSDVAQAVAVDSGGNVAVTGYFQGTANFGGQNLNSAGANDAFAARYDVNGGHVWSVAWGASSEDRGSGVATDSQGNVVVTGTFTNAVNFGGGAIANSGGADIFLVKYSAAGAHVWSRGFGTTASISEMSNAVGVDGSDNVLLTGSIVGSVDFGGGPLVGNGSYDVFIAKFRSDASHVWSKRYGALYDDHGWGITADSAGNVVSTGDYYQSIDFGGGALVNEAGTDSYVVKLTP